MVKHISPEGITVLTAQLGDQTLKLGVVSGLANAELVDKLDELDLDIIEVMACPGVVSTVPANPKALTVTGVQRTKGLVNAER